MKGLWQAALLAAPALARAPGAVSSEGHTPSSAFITIELPNADLNNGNPYLGFRFDVFESADACGVTNASINGIPIPAGTHGPIRLGAESGIDGGRADGVAVVSWDSDCVFWGAKPHEQRFRLRIDSINGVDVAPPAEDQEIVIRFRQTNPVRIIDVEQAASVFFFDAPPAHPPTNSTGTPRPDHEMEINGLGAWRHSLEDLYRHSRVLRHDIEMREHYIRDRFGPDALGPDFFRKPSFVGGIVRGISHTAKALYSNILGQDDFRGPGGPHGPHHMGPGGPPEGHPRGPPAGPPPPPPPPPPHFLLHCGQSIARFARISFGAKPPHPHFEDAGPSGPVDFSVPSSNPNAMDDIPPRPPHSPHSPHHPPPPPPSDGEFPPPPGELPPPPPPQGGRFPHPGGPGHPIMRMHGPPGGGPHPHGPPHGPPPGPPHGPPSDSPQGPPPGPPHGPPPGPPPPGPHGPPPFDHGMRPRHHIWSVLLAVVTVLLLGYFFHMYRDHQRREKIRKLHAANEYRPRSFFQGLAEEFREERARVRSRLFGPRDGSADQCEKSSAFFRRLHRLFFVGSCDDEKSTDGMDRELLERSSTSERDLEAGIGMTSRNSSPAPSQDRMPTPTMEQAIAQFRVAADVVGQMIAAEEGRIASVQSVEEKRHQDEQQSLQLLHQHQQLQPSSSTAPFRPPRSPPPLPSSSSAPSSYFSRSDASSIESDFDDMEALPPAYSEGYTYVSLADASVVADGFQYRPGQHETQ